MGVAEEGLEAEREGSVGVGGIGMMSVWGSALSRTSPPLDDIWRHDEEIFIITNLNGSRISGLILSILQYIFTLYFPEMVYTANKGNIFLHYIANVSSFVNTPHIPVHRLYSVCQYRN